MANKQSRGAIALKKALKRFKDPRGSSRKAALEALLRLEQRHAKLSVRISSRSSKFNLDAIQAGRAAILAAKAMVESQLAYLNEMRKFRNPVIIKSAEEQLAAAEGQLASVITMASVTGGCVALGNKIDEELWEWFDQLTETVATAFHKNRIPDIVVITATGTLIVIGIGAGPALAVGVAAGSSFLLAQDLIDRNRKWEEADSEEARLEAATKFVDIVVKLADSWLGANRSGQV